MPHRTPRQADDRPTADRPPVLRFLLLFFAGLALATGLAALSPQPEASPQDASLATTQPSR